MAAPLILTSAAPKFYRTSPDGATWTTRSIPWATGFFELNFAVYVAATGRYYVTDDTGYISSSPDGITWDTPQSPASFGGAANLVASLTYSPSLGMFVLANTATKKYLRSTDFATWTAFTLAAIPYGGVWWVDAFGKFIALAAAGQIMTSSDAATWSGLVTIASGSPTLFWLASNATTAVVVGAAGTVVTSTDGTTWTSRTSGTTNALRAVCWGAGQFIAVGDGPTCLTSPDGVTWTARTVPTTNGLKVVCRSDSPAMFVAVDSASQPFTSPDGVTWTARDAAVGSGSMEFALTGTSVAPNTLQTVVSETDVAGLTLSVDYPATPGTIVSETDVAAAFGLGAPIDWTPDPIVGESDLTDIDRLVLGYSELDTVTSQATVSLATVQPGALQPDLVGAGTDVHLAAEVDLSPDAILAGTDVAAALAGYTVALTPDVIGSGTDARTLYVPDLSDNAPVLVGFAAHARVDTVLVATS